MPVRTVVSVGKSLQLNLLLVAGLFLSTTQAKAQGVDDNGPPGVYTLVTVNGSKLPARVSHGDVAIQVRSGTFTINADGTCSSKVVFGSPSGDDVTRKVNATYKREGKKLNMQWEGAGKTAGTVKGDSFTMNNEGIVFAYKRRSATPESGKQKVLDGFLGTWRSAHTQSTPVEKTLTGELTYSRVLGGRFVQEQGKLKDMRTEMVMYTYDRERKCYRWWRFPSTGQPSEATGQWDADKKTITWTYVGSGSEFTTIARTRFVDDNTFEYDFISKDGEGKVVFRLEGKATRVRDSKE